MTVSDARHGLHLYLQSARDALLWKLDGLSEYDVRRPRTPTGTNLLGLVKHATAAESGYLGDTFGRPADSPAPWSAPATTEPHADMWATAEESREHIVTAYRRAWAHADATIDVLALDTVGRVPWWPRDRNEVTLHHAVVRVIADTHRHAGHADILRELHDGAVGMHEHDIGVPQADVQAWQRYRNRLERAARAADDAV